tara:strand:- start:767 stop:1006 length:240 start_codon:yes stop_codon:yes gene_type:complete
MTQGKRKDQIKFSSRMVFAGFVGITLCVVWVVSYLPNPTPPTEGIPHNYYHPKVWGHDTTHYPDEDVMWVTGDGDTIWE